MARRSLAGNRVLITGASSGIGRALALELVRHRARVVALARREALLVRLADEAARLGHKLDFVVGDVTDPQVRHAAIQRIGQLHGGLDTLINNAGVGALGSFAEASEDRLRRIMEVNFFAPAGFTREALPALRAGNQPLVVNVSSVLGHRAVPRLSEYCASKSALQGLSESLRAEFAPAGIDLLVVSPGTTESEFFDNLLEVKVQPLWPGRPRTSAESVAREVAHAMERGRREVVPSWSGRFFCWLSRLAPGMLDRYFAHTAGDP